MSTLTGPEIGKYAEQGGFNQPTLIQTAIAIALAESGGNTNSHNSVPPDDSYGLWQINMIGDLKAERLKQFNIQQPSDLYDPLINAKAAWSIYQRSGFDAWTTYTSEKYKTFMDQTGTTTDTSAESGVTGAINTIGENLIKGLDNALGVIAGLVFVVLGFILISRKTTAPLVKKAVKGIIP